MKAKSIGVIPAIAIGFLLNAGSGRAATTDRLYIKKDGVIAFAIDPSGHMFSRSGFEHPSYVGVFDGFQIRNQGVSLMEIFQEVGQFWFGKLANGAGMVYANFSSVPYRSSGSFVFYYRQTPTSTKTGMVEVDNGDNSMNVRGNYAKNFAFRKCSRNLGSNEWTNLIDAWLSLDNIFYPGSKGGANPTNPNAVGGVSFWDKQDQIHKSFGQHSADPNAAFLPWHREFTARLEDLLRQKDPLLSLPYWDWTVDPTDPAGTKDGVALVGSLFAGHLGSGMGTIGAPFTSIYNGGIQGSRDVTNNPADPPADITRYPENSFPVLKTDDEYMEDATFDNNFAYHLEIDHGATHQYLGNWDPDNNIAHLPTAPQDPIFFFIHSNVDRIWAKWQRAYGHPERMAPETVFGFRSSNWPTNWNLIEWEMGSDVIDPWAGGNGMNHGGGTALPLRPWTSPDNQTFSKSYVDPTILVPRNYEDVDGNSVF